MDTTATESITVTASQKASSMMLDLFGYEINMMAVSLVIMLGIVLFLFWRIQRTDKLDFADMITKDGQAVSLTKILQLIGGLTSTWIMIKLTLTGGLTETILGIYLAYVAGVEGYSKYVAAKYNYSEKSVRSVKQSDATGDDDDVSLRPPKD